HGGGGVVSARPDGPAAGERERKWPIMPSSGLDGGPAKPARGVFAHNRRSQGGAMIRYLLALLFALVVLAAIVPRQPGPATGGRGTPQQQRACQHDVLRHCRDVKDQDDFTIANCLRAHERQISPACRQLLNEGSR